MINVPGVEIREWCYGDLSGLELREPDRTDMEGIDKDAMVAGYNGPKHVIVKDGNVIAAFGFYLYGSSASIWSMASSDLDTMPLLWCKVLRRTMNYAIAHGCRRIDCLVTDGHFRARNWLKRIAGMDFEGTVHCCEPNGKDRWLMAWWKGKK